VCNISQVWQWSKSNQVGFDCDVIRGSFDKYVAKQHQSISFTNTKIQNIHFVGNLILSTGCEFYYDDITVTSFINIKYGAVAVEVIL